MERIYINTVHMKVGKYQYLLNAEDDLTGWKEGKAVVKCNSKTVAGFINELVNRYGAIKEIVTDNGSEYQGEAAEAIRKSEARHIKPSPYHPEANIVERGHQSIVNALIKLSLNSPSRWHEYLGQVYLADRISTRIRVYLE